MNYDTAWSVGSDCFLTTSEPLQSPFAIGPRPYACLVRFWCAPECDCCIRTCPNEPQKEGQRNLVQFNQTKWGRCESTLRPRLHCRSWCSIPICCLDPLLLFIYFIFFGCPFTRSFNCDPYLIHVYTCHTIWNIAHALSFSASTRASSRE